MIGVSQHYLGDQPSARRHRMALARAVTSDHTSHIVRFQIDQQMIARVFLARTLWLQGLPDQAMRTAESSIENARAANHALSLCYALALAACPIALLVGDVSTAEYYARMLREHSTRHALGRWRAWGRSYEGVLVIKRGDVITGLRLLRAAFEELGEANVAFRYLTFLGEMPEAVSRTGQIPLWLAAIQEALAWTEQTESRWPIAELLRVKGELLLLQDAPGAAGAAEDHFRQALDWARRQGALSWELRAATSLTQLLQRQRKTKEAHKLLFSVYDQSTEGFETVDLKSARALIDNFRRDWDTHNELRLAGVVSATRRSRKTVHQNS